MAKKAEEQKSRKVRFDFPTGMAAEEIAAALREAVRRVREERQGGQQTEPEVGGESGR